MVPLVLKKPRRKRGIFLIIFPVFEILENSPASENNEKQENGYQKAPYKNILLFPRLAYDHQRCIYGGISYFNNVLIRKTRLERVGFYYYSFGVRYILT